MNNNKWNEGESWYAPLERQAKPAAVQREPKKKTGWTPLRITGAVCILLALIVSSSLLFSGMGASGPSVSLPLPEGRPDREQSEETPNNPAMPKNPAQFFAEFYEEVTTDVAEIDIPQAPLPIDHRQAMSAAPEEELTLQELYEKCSPSIVAIAGYQSRMIGYNWGTGVILSADGLILTNTHVIDKCDSATVTLWDDRQFEALLVGADSISDVALLKIDAKGLPAAELGESGTLRVGDRVAAIGNPLGEDFRSTLTDGIVSAIERGVQYNGHSMTLLQTNTALNEGNSGGALFNMYGQVVGVTNMKMMSSYSSIEGIGFAIPSATVCSVVNSLVQFGEVRGRPSIGVTVGAIPDNAKEEYDLPDGLYVTAVTEGSDAAAKGILPGDVIMEVEHIPVTTTTEINEIKNKLRVGDSMSFTIWRNGEVLEIDVTLMDTNDVYGK